MCLAYVLSNGAIDKHKLDICPSDHDGQDTEKRHMFLSSFYPMNWKTRWKPNPIYYHNEF